MSALRSQDSFPSAPALGNSAGAASTLAEISKDLLFDSKELDYDHMRKDRTRRKELLQEKAEMYGNTTLVDGAYQQWKCTEDEAQLVNIAAVCSRSVYEGEARPTIPRHSTKRVHALQASMDGTVKASAIYVVDRLSIDAGAITTIVIAIRGSKSVVDWVINSNNRATDASDFIDMEVLHSLAGTDTESLLVHRGFLTAARELVPRIENEFNDIMALNPGSVDVVFTGHSAGGAVTSLLFAHFFSNALTKYEVLNSPHVRLSCITFGAPPIFSRDVLSTIRSFPADLIGRGLLISFMNEGDPVPRSDDDYVRVLLQLLRKHGNSIDDSATKIKSQPSSLVSSVLSNSSKSKTPTKLRFTLPQLGLHALGDLVVLRDTNADADDVVEEDIQAVMLRPHELGGLLFANFFAHEKDEYVDVAGKLARGEFNGQRGWVDARMRDQDGYFGV